MSEASSARVSEAIHEAVCEPERWPQVATELARAFDAPVGIFTIISAPQGVPDIRRFALHGVSPSLFADWIPRVPWGRPARQTPVRTLTRIDQLVPHDQLPVEFLETIIRPYSMEHGLGLVVINAGGTFASYSVFRTAPFAEEEERRFVALARPFEQAAYHDEHLRGSMELIYRSAGATVLLAADRTVTFVNAAAERLLRGNPVLQLVARRLRAVSAADQQTLDDLLHRALQGGGGASAVLGQAGIVGLTAVRVQGPLRIPGMPAAAVVALHLSDPEARTHEAVRFVRESYGLTSAETHLVEAILRGHGLPEASAALGVALTTAKTHLQHVFQKTGTRRQAELARLAFGATP